MYVISGDNTRENAGAHYTLGHIFLEDNINIYIYIDSMRILRKDKTNGADFIAPAKLASRGWNTTGKYLTGWTMTGVC